MRAWYSYFAVAYSIAAWVLLSCDCESSTIELNRMSHPPWARSSAFEACANSSFCQIDALIRRLRVDPRDGDGARDAVLELQAVLERNLLVRGQLSIYVATIPAGLEPSLLVEPSSR